MPEYQEVVATSSPPTIYGYTFIQILVLASKGCVYLETAWWSNGSSRSSKVIDFGTNWKRTSDFLLVIKGNLGPIFLSFSVRSAFLATATLLVYIIVPTRTLIARFRPTWWSLRPATVCGSLPVFSWAPARSTSRGFRSTTSCVRSSSDRGLTTVPVLTFRSWAMPATWAVLYRTANGSF